VGAEEGCRLPVPDLDEPDPDPEPDREPEPELPELEDDLPPAELPGLWCVLLCETDDEAVAAPGRA
jgi:hypothetical protein